VIIIHKQVYIVYLGHLPSTDASEPEGFSAVEFAHQDLLNEVLDDGRSTVLFSVFTRERVIAPDHFVRTNHAIYILHVFFVTVPKQSFWLFSILHFGVQLATGFKGFFFVRLLAVI
jgi:hypothetical protein